MGGKVVVVFVIGLVGCVILVKVIVDFVGGGVGFCIVDIIGCICFG